MKLSIYEDNEKMAEFIVERSNCMYTVTPKVYNKKFDELNRQIRFIRVMHMTKYLQYNEIGKYNEDIEQEVIEDIRSYTIQEIAYYNHFEGNNYRIIISN